MALTSKIPALLYTEFTVRFSSPFARNAVFLQLKKVHGTKVADMLRLTSRVGACGALRGYMLEKSVHDTIMTLRQDRSLSLRRLKPVSGLHFMIRVCQELMASLFNLYFPRLFENNSSMFIIE